MPVNERVQEAPVSTLRAMFAGIGRILNFTDKIRNKPATAEAPAEPDATAAAPEGGTLEDTAAPETTAEPDTETPEAAVASPAETGVPDAVTAEAAAPEAESPAAEAAPAEVKPKARSRARKPAAKPAESEVGGHVKLVPSEESAEEPAAAEPAVAETVAAEAPAVEVPAAAPAADLPLANYDDLTIASLRARLRNLSVAQLGQLIEYEKNHAGRADVIAMFERRVAKIESEG